MYAATRGNPFYVTELLAADPQMLRGVGGTGLGLYICKELVGRMGGSIWVESNEDKGSVFVFELPTADVVAHGGSGTGRLHFKN